jgi:hypothetical protein
LYPFERSLVARLKNKPFVIVGVNSDGDKAALQKAMKKENITWRSFWDRSTDGSIHTIWNIQVWPTIYVIGPKGAIRGKFVGAFEEKDLERLVDDLVKSAGK